jgi:hypothetical protein
MEDSVLVLGFAFTWETHKTPQPGMKGFSVWKKEKMGQVRKKNPYQR